MKGRKEVLKELIKSLHDGTAENDVEKKLKNMLGTVTQAEISQVEEELIEDGMPIGEIRKFCDIHLAVFKESLEKEEIGAPEGHPVHILMEEHKKMLDFAVNLSNISKQIMVATDLESVPEELESMSHIIEHLKESESHYTREENVLFPYLEKHGVTQPPAIMWMEHDKIREMEKAIYKQEDALREDTVQASSKFRESVVSLAEFLSGHFYKENNVLFPVALKTIVEEEWKEIRNQFDKIGYCCFTPQSSTTSFDDRVEAKSEPKKEGMISFEAGSLSSVEIEAIFNNLPVDVTFVGKDDRVKYFSQSKERIFVRAKAVIGRRVQNCHPEKSVHIISKILDSFKNGDRDVAEFWISLQGKLIMIRYFALRDQNREYLGCLEVTQDITNIKKIEGEKRLLDWK